MGWDVSFWLKKVAAVDISDQLSGKPKLTRYSTTFSRLLMLILDMSEEQQLFLLNQAKHIVDKWTKHRNPCLIPVKYSLEKHDYNSFMLDINAFGAYIEPFPVGQELNLNFFNPFSHKHIDLEGEIIWSSNYAIGVKFNNLPRRRSEMIDFFVETDTLNRKAS